MVDSGSTIDDRKDRVRQVLAVTLALNIVVLSIKAALGWWLGSLSLLSDALHSVTDSANNVLGLAANQVASPQPDREHPYGHQKFDAIGALGIAAFLGVACFEILQGAVERLLTGGSELRVGGWESGLLLVVLGINIFVALYERSVGRAIDSNILVADAKHTMGDVWITMLVICGLLGAWAGWAWLDVLLAFPVALLVFKSGWEVLQENLPWLVDAIAIAPEAIHREVMQVSGVVNCHAIASRGVVGRQIFIEMHLIVDATDVEAAHEITEAVEGRLKERYGPARILVHVEPPAYASDRLSYDADPNHQ